MSEIGVLIETDEKGVKPSVHGVITAARSGGANNVAALVFDPKAEACKADLEKYGVSKVIGLSGEGPAVRSAVLAAAVKEFGLAALMGISSSVGRDVLARVACILGAPMALDCTAIDFAEGVARKSHFSGKTTASIKLSGDFFICGMRPNSVEPAADPVQAETALFAPVVENGAKMVVGPTKKSQSGKIDLTEAEIIITGGRPMASADNFKILYECAEALGAAVGASRAAVDAGYAPHSMQVGQTGKTVSPKLYIGCGISGSVQHYAGMKTSKVIVGVNTDKDAPIFGKCDYGIIGDLFEVVPLLKEVLLEKKSC